MLPPVGCCWAGMFFFSFLFIILADGQSLTSSWKRPRIWRTFSHRFVNGYEWNVDNLLLHFYKWIRHASSKRKSRRWKRNNIILQDLIIIFQMMDDIVQLLFFLLLSYSYTQFKWKEEKAIAAASTAGPRTQSSALFSLSTLRRVLYVYMFSLGYYWRDRRGAAAKRGSRIYYTIPRTYIVCNILVRVVQVYS